MDLCFAYPFTEKAAIIIGCLEIIIYSTLIAVIVPCLIYFSCISSGNYVALKGVETKSVLFILIGTFFIFAFIFNIWIATLLIQGVKKRESKAITKWLKSSKALLICLTFSILLGDIYLIPFVLFCKMIQIMFYFVH